MVTTSTGSRLDTVVRGGRVIDPETGFDGIVDVGVTAGRVAAVGPALPDARVVIDATGRIVTAGFIDLHSHAQTIPSLRLQALDGVTTALELESGAGDVSAAYAQAINEGRPVNVGFSASWAQARMHVLDGTAPVGGFLDFCSGMSGTGWQQRASRYELDAILSRLERELTEGALGVGVLVGYAPGTGRGEYFEVAQLAARASVPTFTHARFKNPDDPQTSLEGAAEVVAAAAGSGAHMHLCHINSTSLRAIDEVAAMVDGARTRGVTITTEAYPYGAGMTAVSVPFLHPDNLPALGIGPQDLVIVATGERPRDSARLLQIRADDPGALTIIHYLDESNTEDANLLERALLLPDTAVASDAIPFTTPTGELVEADEPLPPNAVSHPRTTGTFARFLRTMVRETGSLTLIEALRRCSLLPAQLLSQVSPDMDRKGRVQEGCDADFIIFDNASVSDRSTYLTPASASVGIFDVLVGGQQVVADGSPVPGALPGQPVRGQYR